MIAPFDPRALDATLDASLTCIVELYAVHPTLGTVPLTLDTASLSYDEQRTPYVSLTGARIAADDAALAAFDETQPVRIRVDVGYFYPGRIRDVHTIALLLVDHATVARPDGHLVFNAYSDDTLLFDPPWTLPARFTAATRFGDAYRAIITAAAGSAAAESAVIPPAQDGATILDAPDTLAIAYDDSLAAVLRDLADRAGASAYHDGMGTWHARSAVIDTTPVAAITPGARGLVHSSEQHRDRANWGNSLVIVYRWRDDTDTDRVVVGKAETLTGPHSVSAVGRKLRPVIVRNVAASQAQANNAAQTILRRAMSRRRLVSVEAARALWWIRPRDTITVATPDDTAQPLVVQSVTFDLPAARMNIKTRTPEE